ncbi:DUF86 domain-containing protein [Dehalococcoidia bacterium]|nr:DUF86 domain-containing protein [Dehalococcoidia bacterium]
MRVDLCLNPKQFRAAEVREMIPALRDLLRRHDVRAAYLFGSALQDRGSCLSDLDVAVLPPPGLDDQLGYYSDLYGDLCQLFRADNVDVVLLNQADLALQARVVLEGHCILEGDGAADLEERVLARHADTAAWRQENWSVTRQLARRGAMGEINMIDRGRVERFVFLIRDAVSELRALSLKEIGLETYEAEKHTRALSEHYLRIAIEAILDLGRHVIVKTGLGVPQEYRQVGSILREKGIVPTDLCKRLEAMGGMRNVLVHLYWDVDCALLYKTIVEEMDIFEQCIEHIFRYLDVTVSS